MNVAMVNPFLAATVNILEKVAGIHPDVKKPFKKNSPEGKGAVSGVVTITGDHTGTAAISFSEKCILQVVSKMFGETLTEMNDDIKDAVGEITNMVSGLATQLYEQEGLVLKAALDQVVMGEGQAIPHLPDFPVLGVPINTEMGEITAELCFKPLK